MKIKKVDDKPMVIHTKEKAKIHAHEPKGAKIKGSNIYTVERGPKTIGAKVSDDKKSYRKSTIHQSESKNKGLSRFKRNFIESNTSIKTKNTNLHIAGRTGALAAGQTAANAFRTFADKPEVDYSQIEQKHPITKASLAPMKAVKKMFVSMELHLDASIDKLDNLAMNVQLDKEKHMESTKEQEHTELERAEAERVEAEAAYSPMVAKPQEYQYNADAFEARGVDEVKMEATHKEAPKVREDKAR